MGLSPSHYYFLKLALGILLLQSVHAASGAETVAATNQAAKGPRTKPLMAAIPEAKWQQVEKSVDRGLTWIATQQQKDGSFNTLPSGQPAITSLAIMAFLSRGHQPGLGPYGERLNRAIDFVLSCQKPNGLFT